MHPDIRPKSNKIDKGLWFAVAYLYTATASIQWHALQHWGMYGKSKSLENHKMGNPYDGVTMRKVEPDDGS